MASAFGGFNIHQDFAENSNALRKNKNKDEMIAKQPATKRAALGLITNTTRVQPSRAVKAPAGSELTFGNDENAHPVGKQQKSAFSNISSNNFSSQNFTIHVDNFATQTQSAAISSQGQPTVQSQQARLQIGQGVLRAPLQPLQTVEQIIEDDSNTFIGDSPMVLDSSITDTHMTALTPEQDREHRILHVPDYTDDIYRHLREMEVRHRPKPQYMRKQPDITASMRSILVDWLVEVAEEYKLHRETLCLAVNYIDRFLSHMSVLRGKLQLVGAASMFLAAKFEEIYPPEVGEFVYITDDTYTKKQVLRMEHLVLKVLSFDVAVPTVNCFVERFIHNDGADDKTKSLAMYLVEQTLVEADPFLKYTPSITSAAAVCLANIVMGRQPWSDYMERITGYAVNDLSEVLGELHRMYLTMPTHPQQAIREKYKQDKYHNVSTLCAPQTLPTL